MNQAGQPIHLDGPVPHLFRHLVTTALFNHFDSAVQCVAVDQTEERLLAADQTNVVVVHLDSSQVTTHLHLPDLSISHGVFLLHHLLLACRLSSNLFCVHPHGPVLQVFSLNYAPISHLALSPFSTQVLLIQPNELIMTLDLTPQDNIYSFHLNRIQIDNHQEVESIHGTYYSTRHQVLCVVSLQNRPTLFSVYDHSLKEHHHFHHSLPPVTSVSLHEQDSLLLVASHQKVFLLRDEVISRSISMVCKCVPVVGLKESVGGQTWPVVGWKDGIVVYSGKGGCLHSSGQQHGETVFAQPIQVLLLLQNSIQVVVGSDYLAIMQPLIKNI